MKKNKTKITVLIFILLCICALVIVSCTRQEITNINSKGTTLICFGDSITFGYGVDSNQAYPVILSQMLEMPVINAGIDGDTTTEALRRLDSDVLSRDPFLVIVEFGGNDFLRKVPLDVTIKNVTEIVDKIQERGSMVAIADISAGFLLNEYRPAYKKLAREKGAIFIPSLMRGIITNPHMKSDFLHPNINGYRMISQRVCRVIKPYVNYNLPRK